MAIRDDLVADLRVWATVQPEAADAIEELQAELQKWKDKARREESARRHYLSLSADYNQKNLKLFEENNALKTDADRYRWLKEQYSTYGYDHRKQTVLDQYSENWDAEIDFNLDQVR